MVALPALVGLESQVQAHALDQSSAAGHLGDEAGDLHSSAHSTVADWLVEEGLRSFEDHGMEHFALPAAGHLGDEAGDLHSSAQGTVADWLGFRSFEDHPN